MTWGAIVLVNLESAYVVIPPVVQHATAVILGSAPKVPVAGHPSYAPFFILLGALAVGLLSHLAAQFLKQRR
jgi:predicted membrane metal-binding protein